MSEGFPIGPEPPLAKIKEALIVVLEQFGPQELTDGVHEHLTFLLDMVNGCLEDGT